MNRLLNLPLWARKDAYDFFPQFEAPLFGECIDIDSSHAYKVSKENGVSFFLKNLHKSLAAANQQFYS